MERKVRSKKTLPIVILSILSLIFLLSLTLFTYQRAYAGKIYQNVYFNGVNIEGKTKLQAKTIIENQTTPLFDNKIESQSSGKTFEATYNQTGIYINSGQLVDNAYSWGRGKNFLKTLFNLTKTVFVKKDIGSEIAFDNQVYDQYIASAAQNLDITPTDAGLTVVNGQITASSAKDGVGIDTKDLQTEIIKAFLSGSAITTIQIPTKPVTPTVKDTDLADAKAEAENFLGHQITMTLAGQNYSPDLATVSKWISFSVVNGKYSASLNQTAIKSYIAAIAAKNDISEIDTKVSAVDGSVLQQGRQGVYINQTDALSKIVAAMSGTATSASIALLQTTKDSQTVKVFPDEGIVPGRFPGQYIDVDLTSQLLTIFNGTTQVGQYQVSTGKASTPTPTGTRYVQGHNPMAWSHPYGLWMPWFMSIGGGYGIHELPRWPNGYVEGANHLGIPVSDGCIRLGQGPAEFVYNWTPDGTPVYIHK